jgi:hypothetical protein
MAKDMEGLEELELEKEETPYVLELTDLVEVGPGYEIPKEDASAKKEVEEVTKLTDIEPLEEDELSLEQEEIKVSHVLGKEEALEPMGPGEIEIPSSVSDGRQEIPEPVVPEEIPLASLSGEAATKVETSLDMAGLESLISQVVQRAVEKATKEAMVEVAERVIGEAIERLRESMLKHS